jgi:hypothetical protein
MTHQERIKELETELYHTKNAIAQLALIVSQLAQGKRASGLEADAIYNRIRPS